ncbi:hypothetical protein QWZ14_12965 [Paeniroseomonas aquatica]|uniref:SPOR domain-containing protein n=2 Tax=Paeniroseomonas aquatica TaxID=373043 RepID=A0ABT8A698_9PROT|nr:hypothetical protein [Paeniroseomonas aquatica]MDN3565275.1 hypothetical protein [Paeniroseomonas aquatica]
MRGIPGRLGHGMALAVLLIGVPAAAQTLPPVGSPPPSAAPAGLAAEAPPLNLSQRGIPAEASAENGVLARDRALASGRRIAWERALAEAGLPATSLSDQRIESLVSSIVIEQERTAPTRYTGRITVNFDPNRVRGALGGGTAVPGATPPPVVAAPASNWLVAVASYRGMTDWLELQRRLRAAGQVAGVDILAIAVDRAKLRLGLRAPAPEVAAELAAAGIALEPLLQPEAVPMPGATPGAAWRLGLAGGG